MGISLRNRNAGKAYADGRKKPANWEYRFYGAVVDGKRQVFSKGGFRTKKEANEAGAKALAEYTGSGSVFKPDSISVSDYMQMWIDSYCRANLKDSTIYNYQKMIRTFVEPEIGSYYLKDLTSQRLQELIWDIFNRGYSRNRVIQVKALLSSSMSYAVEPAHLIQQDPMVYVKLPSTRAVSEVPSRKKDRRPVTDEEWSKIMERFPEGHPAHIPLVLAYRCGFRMGECFGLMWEDVDWDSGTITVQRQIQFNNLTKVWEFTPPKYESYRTVSVDKDTMSLLRRCYDQQQRAIPYYAEHYKQLRVTNTRPSSYLYDYGLIGNEGEPVHMIMSRDSGELIHSRIMQHVGRVIHGHEATPMISADWDFHSLRHTHASMLDEAGIPMQMIQERLGHATIKTTGRYTHATEGMRSQLAEMLDHIY